MATRPTHGDADTGDGPSHLTEAAPAPAPVLAPRATPEEMAASAIGAQVILDYNGAGSLGARGGAGATMEENAAAYEAHMVALGLDPVNPSGPPSGPVARAAGATAPGKASRISSLAAGIITGDPGTGGGGATAPANTAVPAVTQAGDTLTCTTGTWSGEPTSYSYAWTIDAAMVGTSVATHTVTAGDVGKVAVCTVSATNAAGTTAAPPSVGVTIADPAAAGTASRSRNK